MSSYALHDQVPPKQLRKTVRGTNIVVQKNASDGVRDPCIMLLHGIAADDATEVLWFNRNLRPSKNLIHPSEGFLQGIKALRPAAVFNTFDLKKSKLRRLAKQHKDKLTATARRRREVAPTAAFRAAIDPRKVPRIGGHATAEEVRVLSRGDKKTRKSAKKATNGGDEAAEGGKKKKEFFTKWRKQKAKKIGKGL